MTQTYRQPYVTYIAGSGITISVDVNPDDGDNEVTITATGGAGSAHTIADEGTPVADEPILNFVGAGVAVTDDAGVKTIVTISEPAAVTAQATADNHIADTIAAHAASAISVDSTTLVGTGTDQQAVNEEFDNAIVTAQATADNHVADATAAHAASAISVDSTTLVGTGVDVQAVFEEIDNSLATAVQQGTAQTISVIGTWLSPSAGQHVCVFVAPYACTVTGIRAYQDTGTGSVVNAHRGNLATPTNFLSADYTITAADTAENPGAVQNTSVASGDEVYVELVSVSGTPTVVTVQINMTRTLS